MTASRNPGSVPHDVRRTLEHDDWRVDSMRPRKTCPIHRGQQMMPSLAPGIPDMCPFPHDGSDVPQG